MKYMLYRIGKLSWSNKTVYAAIIVELAVGILILTSCLNLVFTNRDILQEHREFMAENPMVIYHSRMLNGLSSEPVEANMAVRYEDYQTLSERYGDSVQIYYGALYEGNSFLFLYEDTNEYNDVHFLFLDDAMFENLFQFEREEQKLYVGSRVYDFLEKASDPENYKLLCWGYTEAFDISQYSEEKVNAVCGNFRMKDGKIQLSEGHELSYEPIPDEENTPYIDRLSVTEFLNPENGARLFIEDCVIGSVDMIPYLSGDYKPFDSILQVKYLEDAQDPSIVPALVNWLNRERSADNYQFSLTDKSLSLEKDSRDMSVRIYQYIAISIVIMAIVLIGTVGVLLVLLNRRKKSMAVAYCCGATRGKSFAELYGEILWVFLLGGILDLAVSAVITPRLDAVQSSAKFYPVNIVFVLLFCLAAALLCCGVAMAGVDDKDPVKNLKEL